MSRLVLQSIFIAGGRAEHGCGDRTEARRHRLPGCPVATSRLARSTRPIGSKVLIASHAGSVQWFAAITALAIGRAFVGEPTTYRMSSPALKMA